MPRVIWTPPALADVARLHSFLKPVNRDAARRAVRAIRQGVKALTARPEMGRPVEERPPEFREWIIQFGKSSYLVLYHYDGTDVAVVAVRHDKDAGY